MSYHYPFRPTASLAAAALAALALLMPASVLCVHAQVAQNSQQSAALSGSGKTEAPKPEAASKPEAAKPPEQPTTGAGNTGNVVAVNPSSPAQQNPAQQKSLTGKAIDKVK